MKTNFIACVLLAVSACVAVAAPISRSPYLGAIVVDVRTGDVLFEDGADRPGYPASMLKMMDLYLVLDRVKDGRMHLDDMVRVTKEAAAMGGSQVWLDTRETFSVEDLLYALVIQSANDAAMALAIHVAGTRDGFVRLMNEKAQALGLSSVTRFQSPHGLPPGKGQRPDMTTPRDFARLCRSLILEHPEALTYTATTFRLLRGDTAKPFEMRSHNRLIGDVAGCDGLKTGYFTDAGYSIASTAQRDGARVLAVVMGSVDRKERDAKARELLELGFAKASRGPMPAPTVAPTVVPPPAVAVDDAATPAEATDAAADSEGAEEEAAASSGGWGKTILWTGVVLFVAVVLFFMVQRRLLLR